MAVATDATSAVAVMADALAVVADQRADRKAAPALKPGQKLVLKAVAASAVSAALSRTLSNAAINALKAKSSASHAHRVSHVNPVKVVVAIAQGVSAASVQSVVSARHVMQQNKISP